jgi:hypothetical protein
VLNDDELGEALRGELRARSHNIKPSAELLDRLGAIGPGEPPRPERRPRSRRRWSRRTVLAGAAVVAAVFIVVAVVALSGSSASPAFAVTSSPNGGVVPMTASCTNHLSVSYMGIAESPAPTIKLIPSEIAPTATIVLAAAQTGPNHVEMAIGKVSGPAPSCVSLSGVGPGLPASPPVAQVHRSSRRP